MSPCLVGAMHGRAAPLAAQLVAVMSQQRRALLLYGQRRLAQLVAGDAFKHPTAQGALAAR
jgi:hypothetical protein